MVAAASTSAVRSPLQNLPAQNALRPLPVWPQQCLSVQHEADSSRPQQKGHQLFEGAFPSHQLFRLSINKSMCVCMKVVQSLRCYHRCKASCVYRVGEPRINTCTSRQQQAQAQQANATLKTAGEQTWSFPWQQH